MRYPPTVRDGGGFIFWAFGMFIAFQNPLADMRPFLPAETNRLVSPTWPLPQPGKEFLRSFGPVEVRKRGGVEEWSGEENYCRAKRALRFDPCLRGLLIVPPEISTMPRCVFRRFFSNGNAVARLEVGLRVGARTDDFWPLSGSMCLALIRSCLSLTVKVPLEKKAATKCDLLSAGQHIARHFLKATTRIVGGHLLPREDWWVGAGDPLMLIEYFSGELTPLPKHSQQVITPEKAGLALSYCRVQASGRPVGIWFLEAIAGSDRDVQRRLRIHLFRLHAERECLKRVLRIIAQGKFEVKLHTPSSDRLQDYLRNSAQFLSRDKSHGFNQKDILETVRQFEDIVVPGERNSVLAALKNIRGNIFRAIDQLTVPGKEASGSIYVLGSGNTILVGSTQKTGGQTVTNYQISIGDHAIFHGDFVVANTITNSFTKVKESGANQEIKDQLEKLHQAVAEMAQHLPTGKAREAASDLETLSKETISESPRKKWYDLSAEGLIEAAKTVGDIATPVVTCVKAILGILG